MQFDKNAREKHPTRRLNNARPAHTSLRLKPYRTIKIIGLRPGERTLVQAFTRPRPGNPARSLAILYTEFCTFGLLWC